MTEYEYAGFIYDVKIVDGKVTLTPKPGQHIAAQRERNIRNATECYIDEHWSRRIRQVH